MSESPFKVGDIVECVDVSDATHIILGGIYYVNCVVHIPCCDKYYIGVGILKANPDSKQLKCIKCNIIHYMPELKDQLYTHSRFKLYKEFEKPKLNLKIKI